MASFLGRAIPNGVVFLSGLAIMVLELVASRLVAAHLGSSLDTWTAVIGVILAGMSLGNYWGGRLSDVRDPMHTLPYLFGAASLLCVSVLWTNNLFGQAEWLSGLPPVARIAIVTALVFFPPACALGTIPPTVARWALQQFSRPGTAMGSVYAWGTAGNILGTFLTGFVLLAKLGVREIILGSAGILAVTGVAVLGLGWWRSFPGHSARRGSGLTHFTTLPTGPGSWSVLLIPGAYVFAVGCAIMMIELVGSRLLAKHVGTSIYTWTSLIGIVLAGIASGNYLGGILADRFSPTQSLPHLFLLCSMLAATILWTHEWLGNPAEGTWLSERTFPQRIFITVTLVFFVPCCALGMVSPVVAKLALERAHRAGVAIGNVYAWGAIGSIAGTFLAGYLLISLLGAQAVLCAVAALLGLIAVCIPAGGLIHSIWAGLVLAGCVAVMAPESVSWAVRCGVMLGVREFPDPDTYLRQSNYYTIKVEPSLDSDDGGTLELVLDNLIHGYVVKGKPRALQYEYELIYASIMERAGALPAPEEESGVEPPRVLRTLFIGGGSYTFPRYVEACYPGSYILVTEIDPAVTRAAHEALFLPQDTTIETLWGDARSTVDGLLAECRSDPAGFQKFDFVLGDAFNDFSVPWHLTTREFNDKIAELLAPGGVYMINIIDNYKYARFLGAYIQTVRQTFDGVAVFCTGQGGEPSEDRETFIVAMTTQPLDWTSLGTRPGERPLEATYLSEEQLQVAIERSGSILLTDNYAPVENLLAGVARDR